MFKRFFQKVHKPKRVLFYRDLTYYTGGHQKVADYFSHLASSNSFDPYISFSPVSRWDNFNPWVDINPQRFVEYLPQQYDYAFIAGLDWRVYLAADRLANQPVINFIQHVRHADPAEELYGYLDQRAVRICVSQQVADAIEQTGRVNGPVVTIPNGVELPISSAEKAYDLVILGIKQPELATAIYEQLISTGITILLVNQQVPRNIWFEYLAASRCALLLPNTTEGFYLPALEAMQYCDLVVVPDCVGNRDFCKHNKNCLMPEYTLDSILATMKQSVHLQQDEHVLTVFKQQMRETLRIHSLASERKAFLGIMTKIEALWTI
ncbi:MAG: hypothetical protein EOO68_00285 [Moraxellaceae bacterium]|nr:MAG: hypothetical protein EOO68_00285 [Moraxellaceae bacterium]